MSQVREVKCPECGKLFNAEKDSSGRWTGTITGAGVGYWVGKGLGLAGSVFGKKVAIPFKLVGAAIGAFAGNRGGKGLDNVVKCPHCDEYVSL